MRVLLLGWLAVAMAFVYAPQSRADVVLVMSGQTNVFLDPAVLAGLETTVDGTTGTVPAAPGFSVAYPISARDATPNTTLTYDPADVPGTITGVIEHSGTLTLGITGLGTINLGNFTFGFDAARVSALRSGYFLADNLDLNGPLFDVAASGVSILASPTVLGINGDLLMSAEAADGLGNPAIAGLGMGRIFVDAVSAVPEPSSMIMLAGVGAVGALVAKRRKKLSS